MSVVELKERHMAATETVNALREQLRHRRLLLLDTDGSILISLSLSLMLFSICGIDVVVLDVD